jgi:hypothetical protein
MMDIEAQIAAQLEAAKKAQTVLARLDKITPGKTGKSRLVTVTTRQILFRDRLHAQLGDVQGSASFYCPSSMLIEAWGAVWLPCWFVNKKIKENAERTQGSKAQKQRLENRVFGGETASAAELEVQMRK